MRRRAKHTPPRCAPVLPKRSAQLPQSVNKGDDLMSTIKAICLSEKKGTQKHPVPAARLVEDWGLEGDAHAGHWHRQVSLLSCEKIEAFRAKGGRRGLRRLRGKPGGGGL